MNRNQETRQQRKQEKPCCRLSNSKTSLDTTPSGSCCHRQGTGVMATQNLQVFLHYLIMPYTFKGCLADREWGKETSSIWCCQQEAGSYILKTHTMEMAQKKNGFRCWGENRSRELRKGCVLSSSQHLVRNRDSVNITFLLPSLFLGLPTIIVSISICPPPLKLLLFVY